MISWAPTYADAVCDVSLIVSSLPAIVWTQIQEIPGVHVRGGTITAPLSVAPAVGAVLSTSGCLGSIVRAVAGVQPAHDPLPLDLDEALAVALGGTFLRDWVWSRQADGARYMLDFQAECVRFAAIMKSASVWAAPGAGKTLIGIAALAMAWRDRPEHAHGPLVVVTRRVAALQWTRQARHYCERAEALALRPASAQRKKDPAPVDWMRDVRARGNAPIVVVSWGEICDRFAEIVSWNPTAIVFDEAHYAKDSARKRWIRDVNDKPVGIDLWTRSTAAYKLAEQIPRRFATTASPIANELDDLWGQLTLIEPRAWGGTASKFKIRYGGAVPGEYGGLVLGQPTNVAELQARLAWSTISIPYARSHAQLPPKRREIRRIPVDQQDAQVDGDARELKAALRADDANRATEIRLARNASRKRSAIVDFVIEHRDACTEGGARGKVIVFDGRKKNVDRLVDVIGSRAKVDVRGVHGDLDAEAIADTVDWFMSHPGPCVLVATWQKLGSSIDLHDADAVGWAMLPWTPEAIEQGEGRVDRLGMKRPVLYVYFVAEASTDEHVAEILLDKLPAVEQITPGRRLDAHGSLRAMLSREGETDEILQGLAAKIAAMDDWIDAA